MHLPPVDSGANTSTATPKPQQSWSPENDQKVNGYISQAMSEAHGNAAQAFAYLRDKRDQPANYYDTNLAIAADYMRARWDTQQHGPQAETEAILGYMALKRTGAAPHEGPGPVSPYSDKEQAYMLKGVQDQTKQMPFWEQLAWNLPDPLFPGTTIGQAKAVIDNIPHSG